MKCRRCSGETPFVLPAPVVSQHDGLQVEWSLLVTASKGGRTASRTLDRQEVGLNHDRALADLMRRRAEAAIADVRAQEAEAPA